MLNYFRDVAPLETAGHTDAEIAAMLSTIRQRPVQLNELESRLTLWGILGRDPRTNERNGPLVDSASGQDPIAPVCRQLLSWLGSNRSQQLSTDRADVAPLWDAGMQLLTAARLITDTQAAALHALAGDLVHPGLTAQDVADSRAAYQAAEAARIAAEQLATLRDEYRQQFDAITNQIGTVEQPAAVVSLRAIADALEA